jgi:hypothetical protein
MTRRQPYSLLASALIIGGLSAFLWCLLIWGFLALRAAL